MVIWQAPRRLHSSEDTLRTLTPDGWPWAFVRTLMYDCMSRQRSSRVLRGRSNWWWDQVNVEERWLKMVTKPRLNWTVTQVLTSTNPSDYYYYFNGLNFSMVLIKNAEKAKFQNWINSEQWLRKGFVQMLHQQTKKKYIQKSPQQVTSKKKTVKTQQSFHNIKSSSCFNVVDHHCKTKLWSIHNHHRLFHYMEFEPLQLSFYFQLFFTDVQFLLCECGVSGS